MFVDARGLKHPEHLKEFRKQFAGLCIVNEDIEVLIDNLEKERKMFELYVRSFKCTYSMEQEGNQVRIKIKAPLNICGL